MKKLTQAVVVSAALALGLGATGTAIAQGYPNKPITLVVPYAAGGTTDIIGRALADGMGKALGQTIVVENKPGAAGSMGANEMATTKPDGYRLALTPVGIFRQPYLQQTRYDPIKDLTYIAAFSTYDFALTVAADSPFKTLDDMIKYAKENPGDLDFSTPGQYSGNQVAMVQLSNAAGFEATHIPYKSDSEAITALLGGHLKVSVLTNVVIPMMQAGKVRVLATAADVRPEAFADAPTLTEAGWPVVVPSPLGLAGPANLPDDIVQKLDDAVKTAMEDPAFLNVIGQYGVRTQYMNHTDYAEFAKTTFASEKELVQSMGLNQ